MIGERPSTATTMSTIGVIAGMLLLAFAGISAIVASTPAQAATVEEMLPRSLQVLGYITTTQYPSSFDSSDSSSSGISLEPSKSFESGSLRSSDARNVFLQIGKSIGSLWLFTTLTLFIQGLFAALYFRTVVQTEMDGNATLAERDYFGGQGMHNDFDNNICEFHKNPWVCLHGLCCPMVRTAHTNEASGICGYWATIFCWCTCSWLTLGMGPCCLLVYWRMVLKNIMKIGDNAITDFCVTLICPWLSVCQMANALDNAMGYRVTGCCEGAQMGGME